MTAAATRRCAAWLGVCVLLVLLAGGGLGAERAHTVSPAQVEALERPAALPSPGHGGAAEARTTALAAGVPLPRPVPRSRRIQTRGLPPPRAPTT